MKTRHIKAVIICSLGLGIFSSCKNILDINPTDVIESNKAIETMADLNKAVIGVYAIMGNTDVQYRTAGNADIIISSLLSDENYLPKENNSGRGASAYKWLVTADDAYTAGNWGSNTISGTINTQSNYAVIDRANRVLRVIDDIPTSSVAEITLKRQLKAELLAIRGYSHFKVLKSYAENYEPASLGVPYMEAINDNPAAVKPSRLTVGQTFAKIEADLAASKVLMPTTFNDITHITSKGISAIQARVFLFEKKWNDAIVATTEVIDALTLAPKDQFPGIWTDANTSEVIWKLKRESGNDRIGVFYNNVTTQGAIKDVDYAPSPKLINSFDKVNDVRFNSYIKIDSTRGINKTPNLVYKYVGGNITSTPGLADIKLFRVAEMYLIRAEAYMENQDFIKASADLNKLRDNRVKDYVHVEYSDKSALLNQIYLERFKELAFEGHRYFDLRRRNMTIDRAPLAPDDNSGLSKLTLTSVEKAYYLPIPGFEMRANINMEQNPQYK